MKQLRQLLRLTGLLGLLLVSLETLGQGRTLTGKVMDEKGEGLPGANLLIQGTRNGTVTDANGDFNLANVGANTTLQVSSIGFANKTIAIRNQTTLTVTLSADTKSLDEVVVVGYGTQNRRDLTGSIATVKATDIQGVPSPSVDQLLQGRAAGIQVISNTGAPGGAVTVRIRGATSINASNDPLYVIDGVPVRNETFGGELAGNGQVQTNPLVDINPSDIESIQILKDASATAIYGARAANGVVLITTKRGKAGRPTVAFTSQTGITFAPAQLPLLSGDQASTYLLERDWNNPNVRAILFPQLLPDPTRDPRITEQFNNNTDWQTAIRQNGHVRNYNLSLNGGSEAVRYAISGGYYDETGTVLSTRFRRYSARFNMDYTLSKKLRLGNSIALSRSDNDRIDEGNNFETNPLQLSMIKMPFLPIFRQDSSGRDLAIYEGEDFQNRNNPVAVAQLMTNEAFTNRAIGNIFAEYDILPGLTFKSSWGIDLTMGKEHRFYPREGFRNGNRRSQQRSVDDLSWVSDNTLTFNRTFHSDHQLNVLLGSSMQESSNERFLAQTRNAPTDLPENRDLNSGAIIEQANSYRTAWGIASVFARATYIYKDKYSIQALIKREGSSRFGANNRYATFPAISGYWRLSSEPFLKNQNFITDLKLRASYGVSGNQNGIPNFGSVSLFKAGGNYNGEPGIYPSNVASPSLSWESTRQTNLGLDLTLLKGRLTITADYYQKLTKDLLLFRNLPGSSGFGSTFQNVGDVQNQGIELSVSGDVVQAGAFKWSINYNIARNRNKILSLPNGEDIIRTFDIFRGVARPGEEIGTWYGFRKLGVYARDEDAYLKQVGTSASGTPLYERAGSPEEAAKDGNGNPIVLRNNSPTGLAFTGGDVIWEDLNKDGVINDADRVVIARSQPDFYGGLNNTFTYKGWSLDFFFQYAFGHEVMNGTRASLESLRASNNQLVSTLRRWRKQGDNTDMPKAGDVVENDRQSDRWVEDGSYIRLKTLTLSYQVPQSLLSRIGVKGARLYATGFNLLTFTRYKGMDPEFNTSVDPLLLGLDYFTFPQPRKVVVGLNFSF